MTTAKQGSPGKPFTLADLSTEVANRFPRAYSILLDLIVLMAALTRLVRACQFVLQAGGMARTGRLEDVFAILEGRAGTLVSRP